MGCHSLNPASLERPLPKLSPAILAAVLFGVVGCGGGSQHGTNPAAAQVGNMLLYVVGNTVSSSYPVTNGSTHGGPSNSQNGIFSILRPASTSTNLSFSTYLGAPNGSGATQLRAVWVDPVSGDVFIGGRTGPSTGSFPTTAGVFQPNYNGTDPSNGVICRFSNSGTMKWCSYLSTNTGSSGNTENTVYAICGLDNNGNLAVAGRMAPIAGGSTFASQNWVGTSGATTTFLGSVPNVQTGYVAKIEPDGSQLVWYTQFGGSTGGAGNRGRCVLDSAGNVYGEGDTGATDLPNTSGTLGPANCSTLSSHQSGFVYKLKSDGTALLWVAYVGGNGGNPAGRSYSPGDVAEGGLALSPDGNHLYVAGSTPGSSNFFHSPDNSCVQQQASGYQKTLPSGQGLGAGYVLDINPTNGTLNHGTFLGGTTGGFNLNGYSLDTEANGIVLDAAGNVIVGGWTAYADFVGLPRSYPGAYRATKPGTANESTSGFVVKLSSDLSSLLTATYIGGSLLEFTGNSGGIGIDPNTGNIYAYLNTASTDFPTTSNALFRSFQGSNGNDIAIFEFNPMLTTLMYSTFLGGGGSFDFCGYDSFPPAMQNCGNWAWAMAISSPVTQTSASRNRASIPQESRAHAVQRLHSKPR